MKIQYLGTAAAEGWPAIFCSCDHCRRAREAGGRNIRTRSQALVNDRVLIDFPADTYLHMLANQLDLSRIEHCFITHNHSDHLHAADFEMRRVGFADIPGEKPLHVYGTEPAVQAIQSVLEFNQIDQEKRVIPMLIRPYTTYLAGTCQVTPLKADHEPRCNPVIYMIHEKNKRLLYAHDTGYFPDETWAYLEKNRPYLDFVSLDCTCIMIPCRENHMDLATNIEVRNRLLDMGCADQKTQFYINHFSHNAGMIYDELVPLAAEYGFSVSYDGLAISF